LFSLVNPFNLKPQKSDVKPGNLNAVLYGSCGPSFGKMDIRITDNWNGSHSVLGGSYGTAGVNDPNMFTGAKAFTPAEVEVWQLVG
jgi:hypothetical protein